MRILLTLLLLLWITACSALPESKRHPNDFLSFAVFANRQGEVEPCGCQFNPKGGLSRAWNTIEKWKTLADVGPVLLFSGGTVFAGPTDKPTVLGKQISSRRIELILEAYQQMGIAAVAPSAADLALDTTQIRRSAGKWGIPVLTTNTVDAQGNPIFGSFARLEHRGTSLFILGIAPAASATPGVRVTDPVAAVAKWVKSHARPEDFVIVIGAPTREEAWAIAEQVPRVRLILGGTPQENPSSGIEQLSASTLFVHPLDSGKAIARIDTRTAPEAGNAFYSPEHAESYQAAMELWKKKLSRASTPTERAVLKKKLARAKSIPLTEAPGQRGFAGEIVDLDASWEGKNPVQTLVEQYQKEIKELALAPRLSR